MIVTNDYRLLFDDISLPRIVFWDRMRIRRSLSIQNKKNLKFHYNLDDIWFKRKRRKNKLIIDTNTEKKKILLSIAALIELS